MWVSGEAVHVEESSIQEISALSAQFFCEPKTALKITNKHIQTLQQTKPSNKQNPPTNKTLQQLFISCRLKAKVFAIGYRAPSVLLSLLLFLSPLQHSPLTHTALATPAKFLGPLHLMAFTLAISSAWDAPPPGINRS